MPDADHPPDAAAPSVSPYRYAVYFAPPAGSAWALAGASWLGRCIDTGASLPQPAPSGWTAAEFAAVTDAPRRYGWHATLRAPFRIGAGMSAAELELAIARLAGENRAFDLPPLRVQRLGDFLALMPQHTSALVPQHASAPLQALADTCVMTLQRYAAALTSAELARHRSSAASPRHGAMLRQWGYPFVFETFRFHLTLSGKIAALPADRVAALIAHAQAHFAPLEQPLRVAALSLFAEPEPGAAFRRVVSFELAP
jgi:Protein of unknown function (DUF1045)